eukprot:12163606-Alexandrium_andersonii.AAC.1
MLYDDECRSWASGRCGLKGQTRIHKCWPGANDQNSPPPPPADLRRPTTRQWRRRTCPRSSRWPCSEMTLGSSSTKSSMSSRSGVASTMAG